MGQIYSFKNQAFNLFYRRDEHPDVNDYRMHTHDTVELYLLLAGHGIFHIEGTSYPMRPGDVLVMRPAESHYIELTSDMPYERIVVNFDPDAFSAIDPEGILTKAILEREAGKQNQYKAFSFDGGSCMHYWQLMVSETGDAYINLLTGVMGLLREMHNIFYAQDKKEASKEMLEYLIVQYINSHLAGPLTLEQICDHFFISKAQLCRLFRRTTATTVWQYITVKRLVMAKQLLEQGEQPTKVYSQCGFNDYSTFSRSYLKHYGFPPVQSVPKRKDIT
jgi:AraC-like DNA-binding protein